MSSYAEPTALPVTCPTCHKQGRPALHPGYHDLFHGERVIRAACIMHGHPVIDRVYTGSAKSNWGTVGHGPDRCGDGDAEAEARAGESAPADLERHVREQMAEMSAGDAAEA